MLPIDQGFPGKILGCNAASEAFFWCSGEYYDH